MSGEIVKIRKRFPILVSVLFRLLNSRGDKGVHAFPKRINLKINVIAQLEFELAYFDSTDRNVNHYLAETPSLLK